MVGVDQFWGNEGLVFRHDNECDGSEVFGDALLSESRLEAG